MNFQPDDPCKETTTLELWGAGELHDEKARAGTVPIAVVIVGLAVALATFFVAFAPPA